jgi:tRNA pseudouridine55 synthase
MSKNRNRIDGWLVIDKPLGMGSTQALGKVKWLLKPEKAGHGGTLDPLATGLLPIALGEATKTVTWAMDGTKTYRFAVQWGAETSTDDLEGVITNTYRNATWKNAAPMLRSMDCVAVQQLVQQSLQQFHGAVQQQPPAYSAIKVDGERAYDLARAGEVVELASREVRIDEIKVVEWRGCFPAPPPTSPLQAQRGGAGGGESHLETVFEVTCGKGTYVRSLARDIGRATGLLAHVIELRRTRVGPFTEADAISLEKLEELVHRDASENSLSGVLRPLSTVLDGIPALAVMDPDAARLRQGQSVLLRGAQAPIAAEAVLVTTRGQPLGICSIEHGSLKTKRLFNL